MSHKVPWMWMELRKLGRRLAEEAPASVWVGRGNVVMESLALCVNNVRLSFSWKTRLQVLRISPTCDHWYPKGNWTHQPAHWKATHCGIKWGGRGMWVGRSTSPTPTRKIIPFSNPIIWTRVRNPWYKALALGQPPPRQPPSPHWNSSCPSSTSTGWSSRSWLVAHKLRSIAIDCSWAGGPTKHPVSTSKPVDSGSRMCGEIWPISLLRLLFLFAGVWDPLFPILAVESDAYACSVSSSVVL